MKSHASMNRIYRLVFNAALGIWVAVAENAKGRGKAGRAACALTAVLAIISPSAYAANAADSRVVVGSGSVTTSGLNTTINQTSHRLAIDWTQLSTAANEALRFNQPNAQAIALNRITGSSPSSFLGSLTANGQVFILNPNGVLFGAGSQVNVGGLVASTLAMSNADFQAGRNVFTKTTGTGSVVNQGTITAASGGYLALLAPEVRNEGVMTASLGTALLAAGNKVTLNLDNGSLLGYSIDQGAINALAENKQLIKADGGQVLLSAKALDALTTATVNNTGVIEARTIQNKAGRIMLMGDMETGTVNVGGRLDASAPDGGNGGFIETSAAHVKVATGTQVTTWAAAGQTGTWLIDPADYTIAASGGDISGATLTANLVGTNVSILSSGGGTAAGSGDINVNDAFSWSANTLSLTAARDINFNAVATATGTAGLVMNTATANGASAAVPGGRVNMALGAGGFIGRVDMATGTSLSINGEGYTIVNDLGAAGVTSANDLQGMYGNQNARFVLGSNIDATATSGWNAGGGFWGMPNYQGRFNGLGHTITGLTINTPTGDEIGLFGKLQSNGNARIANVGLVGGSFTGRNYVGSLVGTAYASSNAVISNSYSTAAVNGSNFIGGLIGGYSSSSAAGIFNSYATGAVTGTATNYQRIGGLVGVASYFVGGNALITNSYATGVVTAGGNNSMAGGLVGNAGHGIISGSYATGAVHAAGNETEVGGLIGAQTDTVVNTSYATGAVRGSSANSFNGKVGGLVGYLQRGSIATSYATGSVAATGAGTTGAYYIGGLVGFASGFNTDVSSITDSYATGAVSGPIFVGGLLGSNGNGSITISGSYAAGTVTGQGASSIRGGLVGATSSAGTAVISNSYATGNVSGGSGYSGGLIGIAETSTTISNSYASNVLSGGTRGGLAGYSAATLSNNFWNSNTATASFGLGASASNTGAAALTTAQFKQSANFTGAGWSASNVGGDGTVWRIYEGQSGPLLRNLLTGLTLANTTLTYNGNAQAGVTTADARVLGGSNASARNAGSHTNGYYSNQQGVDVIGGALTINQANLLIGTSSQTKTYDGNVSATGAASPLGGQLYGSDSMSGGSFAFTDKNAGTGKTVTVSGVTVNDGNSGNNYNVSYVDNTTSTVLAKALTYTTAAANKAYDGDTTAAATLSSLTGLMGSETVTAAAGASFNTKDVLTANMVTVNSATLADGTNGGLASNYTIATGGTAAANITAKALTYNTTATNKTYDGNSTAAATLALTNLVAGETLVSTTGATFNTKDVTTANLVTVNTVNLADGSGLASNYSIASGGTAAANITAKALIYFTAADNKTYDGNTAATATLSGVSGFIGGETVTVSGNTASFNTKDVLTANLVTVNSATLADGINGGLAGNYSMAGGGTAAANINAKALTYTTTAANKVYDGGLAAVATISGLIGLVGAETVTASAGATFNTKDVATANLVTVNSAVLADGGNGGLASNYAIAAGGTAAASITQKALTISGVTASNKIYDQGTSATVSTTGAVYAGLVGGDALTVSATGLFADKNAATGKTVNLTSSYTGADVGNYAITSQATTTADITQKALTLSGITASNKTYDRNDSATVNTTGALYAGLIGGDALTVNATGTFTDKNAATGKTVNLSSSYTGADVNNYAITNQATTTADITQKALAISGVTAANKVYDQTTSATISTAGAVYSGLIAGDVLAVNATGLFSDKNAANGKTVNLTNSYLGADVNNYAITDQASTTANITQKALTVSGVTAANKTYDQGTAATVSTAGAAYSGLIGGDAFTVSATGTFTDKDAATGKTVNLVSSYLGADVNNYVITNQASTSANITPKALTVSNITASNKIYDQNSSATVSTAGAAYTGLIAGDALTVSATGTFTDKNAATGKTVNLTSSYLGADVNNYAITNQASTTANITPKALTVSGITADNKVYDRTDSATVNTGSAVYSGLISGDVLAVNATGAFTDKNAANGKTVNLTSSYLGADANNYAITDQTTTTANIGKLAIVGTITGQDKVYDSNTTATIGFRGLTGVLGTDAVSYTGGTASFGDKNAGRAKTLTATGLSLTGADAGNYSVNSTATSTNDIDKANLAVTAAAQNKVYDATTAATLTYTDNRVAGDNLAFSATASFADKNVGTAKTVNYSGLAQTGLDANNYTLISPTSGTSSADITRAPLSVTANNDTRLAGGAPYAGGNGVVYSGLVGGEAASVLTGALTYGGTSQGASAAGSYAITPGGLASGNYAISFGNGTLVLTPASLAVSGAFAGLKLDLTNPVEVYNSTLSSFSSSFKSDIAAALGVDTARINVQSLNSAANDE